MRGYDRRPLPGSVYTLIWQRTTLPQVMVIVLGLSLPPLAVIPLEIQRRIVDDAIPAGDFDMLLLLGMAYALAMVLAAVIKFLVYYLRGLIEAKVTRILRQRIFEAQQRRTKGDALSALGPVSAIVAEEAYPIGGFAAEAVNTPLIEGGAMVGVFGFMLVAEPALAAIGLGAMALEATVVPVVQRRINLLSRRRINALRRTNAALIATAEGRPGAHLRASLREIRLAYILRLRMNVLKAGLKAVLKLTENVAAVLVLGVGGAMAMAGDTTVGVIVAFLSGLSRLREPWSTLIAFYRDFADARIKYALITSALGAMIEIESDAPPAPVIRLDVH